MAALAAVYPAGLLTLTGAYMYGLLHPACPPASPEPPLPEARAIRLTGADGVTLPGWYLPPRNGAAVMLLGGLGANQDAMLPELRLLAQHGFGAVTLANRHCAGEIATLGCREAAEFDAMLKFLLAQPEVKQVGALGFSVGGVVVAAGAARHAEVAAVVMEGNFPNLYAEMTAVEAAPLGFQWQVQRLAVVCYRLATGCRAKAVSPLDDLAALAGRPVLLVHGELEAQRTQPWAQLAAAGENANLWLVPGAGHGGYATAAGEDYERRLVDFFSASLLGEVKEE